MQIKLFGCDATVNGQTQKALALVCQTSINDNGYNVAVFNFNAQSERLNYYHQTLSGQMGKATVVLYKDDEFVVAVKKLFNITRFKPDTTDSVSPDDVHNFVCLDEFVKKTLPDETCLSIDDKDVQGESVADFMGTIFSDFKANTPGDVSATASRPLAFARRSLDYKKTFEWFEQNHKELLDQITPKGNVQTFLSNYSRQSFALIQKYLFTDYNEKGSHCAYICGSKGSGKSTIISDICYVYHLPLITLTVDCFSQLRKFFKEYGVKEMNPGKFGLGPVESAAYYCAKYNLPTIYRIEEGNNGPSELYSELAPFISDGVCSVGTETIVTNPSLFTYFILFNPADNGINSLVNCDKMYDRAIKINVDKIDKYSFVEGYTNKQMAAITKRITDKDTYYQSVFDSIDSDIQTYLYAYPMLSDFLDNSKKVLRKAVVEEGISARQATSFIVRTVHAVVKQDVRFVEGEYTPHYCDDIETPIDSSMLDTIREKQEKINNRTSDLIDKINKKLFDLLSGDYPHVENAERFAPYISKPRGVSWLLDLIVCNSSVKKGVYMAVANGIFNDFSFTSASTDDVTGNDSFPEDIAQTVIDDLSSDINELQALMFTKEDEVEYNKEVSIVDETIIDGFGTNAANNTNVNGNSNGSSIPNTSASGRRKTSYGY